ncbi:MAG: tetratricopeptide repeat protein [Spirochaetota bacterium]|nr:tetratricopeptide repeat protein [Spirochaetota bacterium]
MQNNYVKASEIIKKILENRSDYVPAIFLRSKILFGQKQYLLAIAELNGLLKIEGFNKDVSELEIHTMLAELYYETKQWQKEIEEYKAILAISPNNIVANNRIGHALFNQKNYDSSQKFLSKAIELDPSQSEAQTDILETLLSSREIDGVVVHGMAWPGFRDDDDCSGMVIPGTEDEKLLRRAYDLIPKYEKPLIVCSYYSERDSETVRNLIRDGKRVYNDVEDAATVLSSLYTYYSRRR